MTSSQQSYYYQSETVEEYASFRDKGLFERETRAIEEHVDEDGLILDLGCGAGRTTTALVERGFNVVAVDLSSPMVRETAAVTDARTAVVDMRNLPFTANTFETVLLSYNGLDEVSTKSERRNALNEIHRVLRPNGRFIFSTHNLVNRFIPYPPTAKQIWKVLRFVVKNTRHGNFGTRCLLDVDDGTDIPVFFADPLFQRCQLRNTGFDKLALLGTSGWLSKYFGVSLFYVTKCRK